MYRTMKDNRRRVIETSMESKSVNLKSAGHWEKKDRNILVLYIEC